MDAATLLREARRHAGLSQRDFAQLSGIALRALCEAESGKGQPSWRTMVRAAEATGISLAWVPAVSPAGPELRAFLRASTGARLTRALAVASQLPQGGHAPLRQELAALSWWGDVHVSGPSAVPIWVQEAAFALPMSVRVHPRPHGSRPMPPAVHLRVECCAGRPPLPLVRLSVLGGRTMFADDPAALALREDCAQWAPQLRSVAQALLAGDARDLGERQRPVHRDPDERGEAAELFHVTGFRRFALPDDRESRSWRLGGEVSLAQWKERGRPA